MAALKPALAPHPAPLWEVRALRWRGGGGGAAALLRWWRGEAAVPYVQKSFVSMVGFQERSKFSLVNLV